MNPTTELLERAKKLSTAAENMYLSLAVTLADIEEGKLFKSLGYETYPEYVEGELGRSKATASKLLKVGQFIKTSGFTPESLDTTYPRLYSALNLLPEAKPEEVIAYATTSSESDLIQAKNEKDAGPHEHEWETRCRLCKERQA